MKRGIFIKSVLGLAIASKVAPSTLILPPATSDHLYQWAVNKGIARVFAERFVNWYEQTLKNWIKRIRQQGNDF
jgi:ABC-type Zn2+ transport system substrate-binding protein/surface adhesin